MHRLTAWHRYQSGERDLVLLSHQFVTVSATGGRTAVSAELVRLGLAGSAEGTSAMAETVGTPCALAAEMMLAGALPGRGSVFAGRACSRVCGWAGGYLSLGK